ncbi:MAG: LptF/LptG family permease [Phocaeicola sp.]
MLRIKKIDLFIIKSFLMLFIGTFFICLFIFMMQFLWRYVDELVGKGLEVSVLAQFFFYSGLTLIPLSLPLAILLAALITFGNFGERYELLAMKAAGISLLRIILPLVFFCSGLTLTSFYFQNVIAPKAQLKLWTLLVSMKQTSPELDIPEGVFYNEIAGRNIYVKKKDRDTGILKDILIYDLSEGFENTRIIWASEGKLEVTEDKQNLYLRLYNGEQFENLKSQTISSQNVPYRRETFREKHTIISFDGGFNMVDGDFLTGRSDSKNMFEISQSIDSLSYRADSIGRVVYTEVKANTYKDNTLSPTDSINMKERNEYIIDIDSLYGTYTLAEKERAIAATTSRIESLASEWGMKSFLTTEVDGNILHHRADWHRKFTLSLSCLIFFFIGASLGAIIRKGGLGMPVVVSVIFFVIYYIIDTGATRTAKSGEMNLVLGVWMSTLVLTPLGIFFTYKSNKDSSVFNIELYAQFFRWLLGLRPARHLARKEVIIEDPRYDLLTTKFTELNSICAQYEAEHNLKGAPNYFHVFTSISKDDTITRVSTLLDKIIEELANSKEGAILKQVEKYPVLAVDAHKSPTKYGAINILMGLFLPVGILFYIRIWRFRLRLNKDLKCIQETNKQIIEIIKNNQL